MTAERHGKWSYYRCVRNTVSRGACRGPFSNVADSHASVAALYKRLRVARELKAALHEQAQALVADRRKARRYQLAGLKRRVSSLDAKELRLGEALAEGTMSKEAYRTLTDKLRAERIAATKAMGDAAIDPSVALGRLEQVLAVAESLYDLHARLPEAERATLLRLVFREIVLERGAIVSFKLHPPFDRVLSDDGPGGGVSGPPPHLDLTDVHSTIRSLLELDEDPFDALLDAVDRLGAA